MQVYKIDVIEFKQYYAILSIIDESTIEDEIYRAIKQSKLYKKLVYTFLMDKESEIETSIQKVANEVSPKIIDAIYSTDLFEKASFLIDTNHIDKFNINKVNDEILNLSPEFILINELGEQVNPVDVLTALSKS